MFSCPNPQQSGSTILNGLSRYCSDTVTTHVQYNFNTPGSFGDMLCKKVGKMPKFGQVTVENMGQMNPKKAQNNLLCKGLAKTHAMLPGFHFGLSSYLFLSLY